MREQTAVVFDDEDLFRSLFTRILREKGIKVKAYSNPSRYFCLQTCVESCPVESPCVDFLITDNKMPEMTGLEFLSRIKQLGCKIPSHRKAIISGSLDEKDLSRAEELTNNVFDKSYSKELLTRLIEDSK